MKSLRLAAYVVLLAGAASWPAWRGDRPAKRSAVPKITFIAPKMISNATSYPVVVYGEHLVPNLALEIEGPGAIAVSTSFVDEHHLTARIPPIDGIGKDLSTLTIQVGLGTPDGGHGEGSANLLVVNDREFPTPYALEIGKDGKAFDGQIYQASPTTGEIHVSAWDPRAPGFSVRTADRPRALARFEDAAHKEWLAVGCEVGEIDLFETPIAADATPVRKIVLPFDVQAIVVDPPRNRIYATSHKADAILAVDLIKGEIAERYAAGANPRYLVVGEGGRLIIAGNLQSEDVSIIDRETMEHRRIRPGPKTPIIGGHTASFTDAIMGGKAARGFAYSEKLHLAFMSTLGPNIGPNKERMEVSMNGGVSVIDARSGRYVRHVSILQGVAEAIALDDARGLLYVADGSTGRIVVMDARKLGESDQAAAGAILSTFALPVPEGVPHIRRDEEFGTNGRAGLSLHFGPKALVLSKNGQSLFVLSRFSGMVVELDTARARPELVPVESWPGWAGGHQLARRTGEVVYFTDLGNTRMSCDTCHPEGHVGGFLFSKGTPIRIYRGHSMRGARWTPPYFTPSRLPSMKDVGRRVLSRNRFFNPPANELEMSSLAEWVGAVAPPPNPYVGKNGELPEDLALPDGGHGSAVRGMALFEGKAGCAAVCHPPPHFTLDQDPKTRGQLFSVGTPMAIRLREELQDLTTDYGQPPPTLVAVWDMFPLFLSGAGGNEVDASAGTVVAEHLFVLRWMLDQAAQTGQHGQVASLTAQERNDLLAYLLTL